MNHKAIVVKQLNEEAAELRAKLAGIEAAVTALGGKAGSVSVGQKRRSRGGWPKGRPRGKRPTTASPAQLAGLAKARAARKANLAAGKKPEGAVLSEGAAAAS